MDAEAYHSKGLADYFIGNYESSIQNFTKAIELDPAFVDAYVYRAIVKYNIGEFEDAVVDFNRSIRLNPNHIVSYQGRSKAYNDLKRYAEALNDINRALSIDSSDPECFLIRGNVLFNQGKYRNALIDINKALSIKADNPDALFLRGMVKKELNDKAGSEKDIEKALELNPDVNKTKSKHGIKNDGTQYQDNTAENTTKIKESISEKISKSEKPVDERFMLCINSLNNNDVFCALARLKKIITITIERIAWNKGLSDKDNGLIDTIYVLHDNGIIDYFSFRRLIYINNLCKREIEAYHPDITQDQAFGAINDAMIIFDIFSKQMLI